MGGRKPVVWLSVVLLLILAGCGSGSRGKDGESTLDRARRQGHITVGFANEKPYAYALPDGTLTGEAVEVARAIFKELGIPEMQGVLAEFTSLIPGLKAGRFDVVTAGMFIMPDRCGQVAFANPEYQIGEALAVKPGNPMKLYSYQDIAANDKAKVAVMGGAVEYEYMLKSGIPADRIVTVPDQPAALAALKAGRVDGITMTGPSLQSLLDGSDTQGVERVLDFKQPVIDGNETVGYGATAFRSEDHELREAFNAELQKLKESGALLDILRPFGFTEAELPGEITAEELCSR